MCIRDSRMLNGQRYTGENQPDDIQNQRTRTPSVTHLLAKGKEAQGSKLKALHSHRDSHDTDTPETSRQAPADTADKPAKDKP